MTNNRKLPYLLNITIGIGLLSCIGGIGIFTVWTAARYFWASDLEELEIVGLFWILGSFLLNLIAFLLTTIYTIINRKVLHSKIAWAYGIILMNIPIVITVLVLQDEVSSNCYVQIKNESPDLVKYIKNDDLSIDYKTEYLGPGFSIVFSDSSPSYMGNNLIILARNELGNEVSDTFSIYSRSCRQFVINKKGEITEEGSY